MVRKFQVPYNAVKFFTRGGTVRFSRRIPLCGGNYWLHYL